MRILLSILLLFTISCSKPIEVVKTITINEVSKEVLGERKVKENILKYTGIFGFVKLNDEGLPKMGMCSFFVVNYKHKQRMLTAAHCCGGVSEGIEIVKVDPIYDICELKSIKGIPFKNGIKLSNKKIKLLDTVYSAGVLRTEGIYLGKGYVRAILGKGVAATSYLKPGMSGGPTFDEDGNLLGVNSQYYLENNNSFFVPNTAIKQFLD